MITRLTTLILILLIMPLCYSADCIGQNLNQSSRKFDEYSNCRGSVNNCITEEDEWARLDNLGNRLIADSGLQAYVISYNSRSALPGSGLRHANYVRNLLRRWVADDTRVHVVDGGRREDVTIELWIVPTGAPAPHPMPTFPLEQINSNVARKYDEYPYSLYDETRSDFFLEYKYYNQSAVLDGFALILERAPKAIGYIVAYDGQRDRIGTAYKLAEKDRSYIYETIFIGELSRVVVLNGGRRANRTAELWIVPPGVPAPTPTPMKAHRKNRKP